MRLSLFDRGPALAAMLGPVVGVAVAGAAWAQDLPPGDPAQGRKVAGMCRTCHGLDGVARIPIAPHIGGEPEAYLAAQLLAFRSGARAHEMMSVVARGLSDVQIADVAAWYGAHEAQATLTADPEGAPEMCVACHGVDGLAVAADVPHLAGETAIYIDTQLKAFKRGKRSHEVMTGIAEALSDDEIRAAADWYEAIRLTVVPPPE